MSEIIIVDKSFFLHSGNGSNKNKIEKHVLFIKLKVNWKKWTLLHYYFDILLPFFIKNWKIMACLWCNLLVTFGNVLIIRDATSSEKIRYIYFMDVVNLKIQLSIYKTRFTADNMNKHNILFFRLGVKSRAAKPNCQIMLSDGYSWIFK